MKKYQFIVALSFIVAACGGSDGTDGVDGKDGVDGQTPVVNVTTPPPVVNVTVPPIQTAPPVVVIENPATPPGKVHNNNGNHYGTTDAGPDHQHGKDAGPDHRG